MWEDIGGINAHAMSDYAFRRACRKDRLEVAKWLWEDVGGINAHAEGEYAFRWVCQRGRLEVAQWLWEVVKRQFEEVKRLWENNGSFDKNYTFQKACEGCYLDIV